MNHFKHNYNIIHYTGQAGNTLTNLARLEEMVNQFLAEHQEFQAVGGPIALDRGGWAQAVARR